MDFADRLTFDGKPRKTSDGYLVADARVARTGIQLYAGAEVGKPELATVRVYRPETEVFSRDSMASFAAAPVTIEHPAEAVTADNWRRLAVGEVGQDVVRDGEWIRVPLILKDAAAIRAVETGKREISMGYGAVLDFTPGQTPDGQQYDAVQRSVKINHLAIVDAARAGHEARIGDDGERRNAHPIEPIISDHRKQEDSRMAHTLIIDGLQVPNVSDEAKAAIEKLQGNIVALTATKDAAEKQVGELTVASQTKDGEIAALKKQVEDAAITPAKLQVLADARAKVVADAKKIAPSIVTDGKTDAEIRKEAVLAKLGDAAKDMVDAAIEGAFAALVPVADSKQPDPLRATIAAGAVSVADTASIRNAARASRYAN